MRAKGLSGTALKEIALALMVLDHIHYFFAFTGAVPEWFSMLGRVSAPLFLFCTAEGFAHTHSRKTYLLRLWALGAGMGAVQFLIGIGLGKRADGFYPMNGILRDLTVACLLWQGLDWLRQRRFGRAAAVIGGVGVLWPAASLALMAVLPPVGQLPVYFLSWTVLPSWTFSTDGGIAFILGGVLLYALREHRKAQALVWAAWVLFADLGSVVWLLQSGWGLGRLLLTCYQWMEVFAAPLMLLYNGQRGAGHKKLFYWFYPAHVYVLYAASCAVMRFGG
ncbi:MAG TPA: conjugal transfer protein TraX [Candidatus Faecalibacterium faecigallinarum]|uniref:Conjugal transfer protein TraX n=1 Tax=Candidatus Faecalibacterium faecigallinarum TaxID=2838577 RepID=A0A9D2T4X4_9FIRM|nr:conjugal transfer protein TraX [Candidatus Faecalibacterium faecigallinarum]